MVGFPHSEILGSKLVRSSPRLIAAYYVLHRLHAPRHPLNALKALDRSHYQCPQPASRSCSRSLSSGKNEMPRLSAWRILIGQIKLTRIHVASLLLPGVRVKTVQKAISLRCRKIRPHSSSWEERKQPNLLSVCDVKSGSGSFSFRQEVVEPDGIEPTTSCLQSTRSPN